MSNGTNIDVTGAINAVTETAGKVLTGSLELTSNALKAMTGIIEPLAKTAIDLVGNVAGAATQILQGISTAIAPKK